MPQSNYLLTDFRGLSEDVRHRLTVVNILFEDFRKELQALAPHTRERTLAMTQIDLAEPQVYAAILTLKEEGAKENARSDNDDAAGTRDSADKTNRGFGNAASEQLSGGFGGDS